VGNLARAVPPSRRARQEAEEADGVRAAAQWVADFLAGGYGPGGGSKLVSTGVAPGGGDASLFRSGATALRLGGLRSPDLAPLVALAQAQQEEAGDHATGATLLAARLVLAGRKLQGEGVGAAWVLDGYRLARRQALAVLASLAIDDAHGDALASVAPDLGAVVWEGLPALRRDGTVRLDDVEVRTTARGEAARWLDGLVVEPQPRGREGPLRVAVLDQPLRVKPRGEGFAITVRDPRRLTAFQRHEADAVRAVADAARQAGVGLVVAPGLLPEPLAAALHDAGVLTLANVPADGLRRFARATGATAVPDLASPDGRRLGAARLLREGKAWLLVGGGPSATLEVPAATEALAIDANDRADRLLRAAGLHANRPRSVPGGGRWQRAVAESLRKSADAAPGKSPLVLRAAADAVASLADDLVRNLGLDPLRTALPGDAGRVLDVAEAVHRAVAGAFDAATQVLRVDARLAKRPSSPVGLRGPGTPTRIKGGDVPPLM
jgi:chaperonin GroEL (HSP60 family)